MLSEALAIAYHLETDLGLYFLCVLRVRDGFNNYVPAANKLLVEIFYRRLHQAIVHLTRGLRALSHDLQSGEIGPLIANACGFPLFVRCCRQTDYVRAVGDVI